jgi:hypothetical protein
MVWQAEEVGARILRSGIYAAWASPARCCNLALLNTVANVCAYISLFNRAPLSMETRAHHTRS